MTAADFVQLQDLLSAGFVVGIFALGYLGGYAQ
jgi:hypothetical protein